MKSFNNHVRKTGSPASTFTFTYSVSFILAGLLIRLIVGSSPFFELVGFFEKLGFGSISVMGFGCVFLFFALIFAAFSVVTPVLAAAVDLIFGFYISSSWSFVIDAACGDISFLCILLSFFLIFLFTSAFVIFSQLELNFYSSLSGVIGRNKALRARLVRLSVIAVVVFIVLFGATCLITHLVPTI